MAPCLQHLQLSGNVTLDMQAGLQSTQLTSLMLQQQLDADSLLLLSSTQPNLQHLAVLAANPQGAEALRVQHTSGVAAVGRLWSSCGAWCQCEWLQMRLYLVWSSCWVATAR